MLIVSSCTMFLRLWKFVFICMSTIKKNKNNKPTHNKQQAKNNNNNKTRLFLCFCVTVEKNYTRSMILQFIAHRSDTPRCCWWKLLFSSWHLSFSWRSWLTKFYFYYKVLQIILKQGEMLLSSLARLRGGHNEMNCAYFPINQSWIKYDMVSL